jgi:hypothetical protein
VNEGWIRRQGGRRGRPNGGGDPPTDGRWMPDRESLGAVRGKGGGHRTEPAGRLRPT